MDIVTVLTRVLQEQQKIVEQQQGMISAHAEKIAKLERLLAAKISSATIPDAGTNCYLFFSLRI